jgi:hypothetical protein
VCYDLQFDFDHAGKRKRAAFKFDPTIDTAEAIAAEFLDAMQLAPELFDKFVTKIIDAMHEADVRLDPYSPSRQNPIPKSQSLRAMS